MGRNDIKDFFPALHLVGADGCNPTSLPDGCTLGGRSQLLLCAKTCNSLTNYAKLYLGLPFSTMAANMDPFSYVQQLGLGKGVLRSAHFPN